MKEKLFDEFSSVSKEEWISKAVADLKGEEQLARLTWETENGISVKPFYTEEDKINSPYLDRLKEAFPKPAFYNEGAREWVNYTKINISGISQANADALEALERGADGVIFNLNGQDIEFNSLLKDIDLTICSIAFENCEAPLVLLKEYLSYLKDSQVPLDQVKGYLMQDPIARLTLTGQWDESELGDMAEAIRLTADLAGFRVLAISSQHFTDAGASHVQELALMLNSLTDYIDHLTDKGLTAQHVFENVAVLMGVGSDYFQEMAKFRAARVLLFELMGAYQVTLPIQDIFLMGVSSVWSKTLYDPYVNMLRNATESMAAILGGVNALYVAPHNSSFEKDSSFSRRIALNISHLLKEESYLDKVVDPAAGSYYLDYLTHTLAEKALTLFKQTEEAGGFIKSFTAGEIQQQIAVIRKQKETQIKRRKQVLVGTNRYPNTGEVITSNKAQSTEVSDVAFELLKPQRAASCFETLRLETDRNVEAGKKRPKVLLALFGNVTMRKARAAFAGEFFGIAGFAVEEKMFDSSEQAAKESITSDADIVVMCAADEDYEAESESFIQQLKREATDKQVVVAGFAESFASKLEEAGVDEFVHLKSDAISVLSDFQRKLF
ncbi:methylmalonyl-CoA mutase family protein [Limibacter armeniacum]|uniref:methylmalonyl-CoA mutase family protein n=1 Tax=Limibacter armeniacum TaxID=466084 RepID=UPI002FE5E08A